VQKNFMLFIVLSIAIMIGWQAFLTWLRPPGELQIVAAQGVQIKGVLLVLTTGGQPAGKVELEKSLVTKIQPGKFDLALEGDNGELELSPASVTIEHGKSAEVSLRKRAVVAKPAPKEKEKEKEAPAEEKIVRKPPEPEVKADETPPAAKVAAAPKLPRRWVTLGSIDDDSPYRMLVTFDSRGAAVERVELNSPRYYDLEDRAGYLGHLAATDAPPLAGAVVNAVGPGTPADLAGVRVGDVIVEIADEKIETAAAITEVLSRTRPGQKVGLAIKRDGKPLTLTADLTRPPQHVVRPEIENSRLRNRYLKKDQLTGGDDPLSFLLTLRRVGDNKLKEDQRELEGVDLLDGNWEVVPPDANEPDAVAFRRVVAPLGLEIVKRYRLARRALEEDADAPIRAAYHLTLSVEVKNVATEAKVVSYQFDGPTGLPTEGWWYTRSGIRDYAVGLAGQSSVTHKPKTCLAITNAPPEDTEGIRMDDENPQPVAYVGVDAPYFVAAIKPTQPEHVAGTRWLIAGKPNKERPNLTNVSCRLASRRDPIKPGATRTEEYLLFLGPKETDLLRTYGLDPYHEYGSWAWPPIWNFIAKPLQWILHTFYALVRNYGIAIVMLTVVVRLGMFPLSRKQVQGAMKMQQLQPEIQKINETHKNNFEARNRAMSELFRKHNYHPLSGCLPMFIQLPIFIGLYWSLAMDVELRGEALIPGLRWCSNLAAPDMLLNWSGWMPKVIQDGWFFIPAMGPYLNILPIFTIVLFVVQQKVLSPPPTNEQMAMQMRIMTWMMVVMGLLFYTVASGLCLYFIASSLWGLAERKLMPKRTAAVAGTSGAAPAAPARPSTNGAAAAAAARRRKKHRK
jgi:YidC/Oxa1 family membrane protein insertase